MRLLDRHANDPGEDPALLADGRRRAPDRREISARWLTGTFLTGITSSILMGVALFAALDGREQLATPPELMAHGSLHGTDEQSAKGSRVVAVSAALKNRDRRRLDVSTIIREGERDVIRTLPFEDVRMTLAASPPPAHKYPAFNPRNVFADDDDGASDPSPVIYGANVDSEVTLHTAPFPLDTAVYDTSQELTSAEVEQVVQQTAGLLTDGAVQAAALQYVDPLRFGGADDMTGLRSGPGFTITPENVSVAARDSDEDTSGRFTEDLVPFNADKSMLDALSDAGYEGDSAAAVADALSKLLNTSDLQAGSTLRIGVENSAEESRIVRASVYRGSTHVVTVALNDSGRFVPSEEPEVTPAIANALDNNGAPSVVDAGDLPSIYDAVYRSALSYGMTEAMVTRLIRILAPDVDFQAQTSPTDQLEVLFSLPENADAKAADTASANSEILYVAATFGGQTRHFYRFRAEDGSLDYYNEDGKSARQFIIRNPVPGARFSRGFGMMRHPILGVMKMHTGDDWAIPRGTPIMAAGNGVVERAGWGSGYGNMTIIRHANGYETVYAHQSAFAKGIVPGVHVRQGQVIGYVGSTGQSTGPHVHFEIRINGQPVDPLRVRLPHSHTLTGDELVAFERERKRIDAVIETDGNRPAMNVASR